MWGRYTWERTAQGYVAVLERTARAPDDRRRRDLLPIHPFFRDPRPENDVSMEELRWLYFGDATAC